MQALPKNDMVVSTQLPPAPCTKEQSDLKLLASQQGYRFTANCY
jgi:hypothetical protein